MVISCSIHICLLVERGMPSATDFLSPGPVLLRAAAVSLEDAFPAKDCEHGAVTRSPRECALFPSLTLAASPRLGARTLEARR
jgi:hypothetical protein